MQARNSNHVPTSSAWLFSFASFANRLLMPSFFISANTASTIGTIIAVVAVLLIHMERNAVVSIKPNIKLQRNRKHYLENSTLWSSSLNNPTLLYLFRSTMNCKLSLIAMQVHINKAKLLWRLIAKRAFNC